MSPQSFTNLYPGAIVEVLGSPIKEGTKIIGAGYDLGIHSFVIVMEHSDFPPVPLGERIPVGGYIEFRIVQNSGG